MRIFVIPKIKYYSKQYNIDKDKKNLRGKKNNNSIDSVYMDEDTNTNQYNDILDNYTSKLHRFISSLGLDDKVFQASKKILEYIRK